MIKKEYFELEKSVDELLQQANLNGISIDNDIVAYVELDRDYCFDALQNAGNLSDDNVVEFCQDFDKLNDMDEWFYHVDTMKPFTYDELMNLKDFLQEKLK